MCLDMYILYRIHVVVYHYTLRLTLWYEPHMYV